MRTNFVKQENSHEPSSVNKAAVHTTLGKCTATRPPSYNMGNEWDGGLTSGHKLLNCEEHNIIFMEHKLASKRNSSLIQTVIK